MTFGRSIVIPGGIISFKLCIIYVKYVLYIILNNHKIILFPIAFSNIPGVICPFSLPLYCPPSSPAKVPPLFFPYIPSQHLYTITPLSRLLPNFLRSLFTFLTSEVTQDYILTSKNSQQGSTNKEPQWGVCLSEQTESYLIQYNIL